MKLAELRAQLEAFNLPDDTPVILARDAEGNGYSPLYIVDDALYEAKSTYSGQMYASPEMRAAEPGQWDEAPASAIAAIFLWPTN
ncbi:hypothetical protein ACFVT5_41005 [Streptomyces sp. NPDC058001]|uniref:hypothetical protein n=1 Tax=Streptomyces sp. NPDC058001 TaxID=3346300 RepID=UPI0036E65A6A